MYWDLYRKQIKKIGSVWWLWIIFENGRRHCPCLNNLQQLWHISWSLIEVISRFGVPLQIHTDQGHNFKSVLFKEVCRLLDVEKLQQQP